MFDESAAINTGNSHWVWREAGTLMDLMAPSLFWKSGWAYGGCIVFLIVLVVVLMIYHQMQRRRWKRDLDASEDRFKSLFNEAPVIYVITENRAGKPMIKEVNNSFLERLGYDYDAVVGTPLADYYSEASRSALLDGGGYDRALKGVFLAEEREFLTRDGQTVSTLLHALPEYDNDGSLMGTRAMFLDITGRKKAEQEARQLESALQQAQKLEAIGTLAGGIAHDFNNILSAVIGYAELVLNTLSTDLHGDARVKRSLQQILKAGLRARDLVQQILTFSRQDERKLKPLQMGPLVKEALQLLRSSLPTTIDIRQEIADHVGAVMADATQIHQIVMNLCTNAAQAMIADGGILRVGLEEVEVHAEATASHPSLIPGRYARLSVADTGEGIPADLLPKIFTPYFTTKEKGKGTGLGLAVVHGIVQGYGGMIDVQSTVHQGTKFHVLIPTIPIEEEMPIQFDQLAPRGCEHILLVDDEPALIQLGRMSLETLGYRVTACEGSPEALEIFRRNPEGFDLLLTDMTMPHMTGIELAREIKRIRPGLPIVLCSGFSDQILGKSKAELRVDAVLEKPFQLYDIGRMVREALDHPG